MLKTLLPRTPNFLPRALGLSKPFVAQFHRSAIMSESQKVAEYKQAGNRKDAVPAHDMVYFKGLTSSKRAFGDFRTVLHTGLLSQIVAMEVPVGGDIGDEVRLRSPLTKHVFACLPQQTV
jgi:hypothetical protein